MSTDELLSVEDLRVEYLRAGGDQCVVDGVSFGIRPGEVFGLMGESGSGKSTIALSLVRLLRPPGVITGGQVRCEGRDVLAMSEAELRAFRWRRVSLVTQEATNALNPLLTIGEQLADPILAHERTGRTQARERAALLLDLVGVHRDRLTSYPHELSSGMRQRVVIAMALALRPALIIMDEPTTALDVVLQKEILSHLAALKEKLGFSVLFIGHDLGLMLGFCDRVGVLCGGRLVETAASATLTTAARHPYTQGLVQRLATPLPPATPRPEPTGGGDDRLLNVVNLRKTFVSRKGLRMRRVRALEDVSFDLRRGEVLAIIGESGSGKTTTARIIARLLAPTSGEIWWRGRDVLRDRTASREYRAQVQMIFQDPFASLNPVHTVGYHLERPLRRHGKVRGQDLPGRVAALLETVGLRPGAEVARKFPHQLSGGQRQRVSIARALAVDPQLILADEPTSMLDVSIRMDILGLLRRLKEERGLSYLYITHDLDSARRFADRAVVLYGGQVVEAGPVATLFDAPAHPYTQLLGASVARGDRPAVAPVAPAHAGAEPGSGCPFATRCPSVMDRCRRELPGLRKINATGALVRCHLYDG